MKVFKRIVLCLIIIALLVGIIYVVINFTMSKTVSTPNPVVTMEFEGYGTVKIELYPDKAPNTVKNFIRLAQRGYYDGKGITDIEDGIIEGGFNENPTTLAEDVKTPAAKLSNIRDNVPSEENKEYAIKGEFADNGFSDNTLSHERGVISMFRKSYTQYQDQIYMLQMMGYQDYVDVIVNKMNDSQSSAFFITTKNATGYDGTYAAFGRVIEGMDVIDKIAAIETTKSQDEEGNEVDTGRPVTIPIIKKVTVETYGIDYGEPETIEMFEFDEVFDSVMQMFMQSSSSTMSY